jgi:hypothetical protein
MTTSASEAVLTWLQGMTPADFVLLIYPSLKLSGPLTMDSLGIPP